jgi:hypothetical protein
VAGEAAAIASNIHKHADAMEEAMDIKNCRLQKKKTRSGTVMNFVISVLVILVCFFSDVGSFFLTNTKVRPRIMVHSGYASLGLKNVRCFCNRKELSRLPLCQVTAKKIDSHTHKRPITANDETCELASRALIEESDMKDAPCKSLTAPELEPSDGRAEYRSKIISEMRVSGVVRINNVISEEMADSMLELVMLEFEKARKDVSSGVRDSERFSNLLSSTNRWDMKLPWSPGLADVLRRIVRPGTPLGDLLTSLVSNNGTVHELAAFVTMPGAGRQVMHADTLWSSTPSVYTCTIALQDVSRRMGPTVLIPGTHTRAAHRRFDVADTRRDLLAGTPHVLSTLCAGDAAVYDSRLLHCGGANMSERPRVLLYLSLLHPQGPIATGRDDVANVATIRPELAGRLTLADLRRTSPSPPAAAPL